jgi:hypothetical protein
MLSRRTVVVERSTAVAGLPSGIFIIQSKKKKIKIKKTSVPNDKHFPLYEYSTAIKLVRSFYVGMWMSSVFLFL